MLIYPVKTLSQLPLILKGFRKERSLTQAAMAERLGITQQSYAYFEANPSTATVERLFMVLRLLDVDIALDKPAPTSRELTPSPSVKDSKSTPLIMPAKTLPRPTKTTAKTAAKTSKSAKVNPAAPPRKRESW